MSGILPNWLEKWLGVEGAGPGEGTLWSLDNTWSWAPWVTLLWAMLAVGWVVFFYAREGTAAGRLAKALLVAIRLVLIAIVIFMIAEFSLSLRRTGLPTIAIVVDDSASMGIEDRYDDKKLHALVAKRIESAGLEQLSRLNIAKTVLLEKGTDLLGAIEKRYRLKLYFVSSAARAQEGSLGEARRAVSQLEARGEKFKTNSDTEVVLRAFLRWDKDCFARLRGMFAIAIWTESSRRLVLARDRVGIKPLYIARKGEELCFGSELKAILAHPEIERQISLPALDCYLALNYIPAPWTMIEGITKVMPGTWVEWRDGAVRSDSYWTLPAPHPEKMSLQSATEELDSLLQSSVSEHLLSDVPLGVWLSGGLDSSTILHYASQASSSKIKTFSISFRGRSFDESSYIGKMVEKYSD